MNRLMIIPAAGLGSRLNSSTPKVMCPVNGKPMIDYLFDLYAGFVDRFILVLHPSFAEEVQLHCAQRSLPIEYDFQRSLTGMVDSILVPNERVRRYAPRSVWITWCDQIAVYPQTIKALADLSNQNSETALMFPTINRKDPYIHLVRSESGDIIAIRHRREGDDLPAVGESDIGVFCLSRAGYLDHLTDFAREDNGGAVTHEKNFLPFIPWLYGRAKVVTFSAREEIESVGINTADELNRVEHHFRQK